MALIPVNVADLSAGTTPAEGYCRALEGGDIVVFDRVPFEIPEDDLQFLLSARQENTRLHKNISYRPAREAVRGIPRQDRANAEKMRAVMRRYSTTATEFLSRFLSPYAGKWQLDYASFRPIEEAGRELPLHKRNELLHVDAFPSRPTHGGRILRFFTNINPTEERVWEIGGNFETLVKSQAFAAGLKAIARRSDSPTSNAIQRAAKGLSRVGLPIRDRSDYDRFMLRFHDHLKENASYQKDGEKTRIDFPPGSSWIVFTDCVPHSVLSGRFALEQTFIVPFEGLVAPEISPLAILERLCGRPLTGRRKSAI